MPQMILEGLVKTENGPECFEVYEYDGVHGGKFTMVDQKIVEHGWVTLNACGGFPAFSVEYKHYYENLMDYNNNQKKDFPKINY
jgi:hypothetical protein